MRQMPIGVQDFKTVRDGNKYYVDKSMLIARILQENDAGVFLYTRPRRFGKSLNLSMLDAYFNIEYENNTWFNGLRISQYHEFDQYKNSFPVISADLRVDSIRDFDGFVRKFNLKLSELLNRYSYLEDSQVLTDRRKQDFRDLFSKNKTVDESEYVLTTLSSLLSEHHGSKVVVLIDEYDNSVNSVSDPTLRRRIIDFLKGVLSPLLKGNESLQLAVVTGVMQITKENIFSGLNNLSVNNILSRKFDEMFGFTDDEVRRICEDYGHPEKFEEAKDWYDGYRFGEADIYNPWSILNYVSENFEPAPYWVNTSGNGIIQDMIENADEGMLEDLRTLGSGMPLSKWISTEMTFQDLETDPDAIYSLMAATGYLKVVVGDDGYLVSIPNRELYSEFSRIVNRSVFSYRGSALNDLNGFSRAVLSGDIPAIERHLYNLIASALSSRVLVNEHTYQAFIVGMLMNLSGRYEIKADFEDGKGYYDIRMVRRAGPGFNLIIELKRADSEGSLESEAREALEQIRERDYAHSLEGQTMLYGISFFGKVPYVMSEWL